MKVPLTHQIFMTNVFFLLKRVRAVAQGPAPNKAVIIFTDVFGLGPPNAQLMADKYAEAGFLAAVPDLFGGAPINHVTMNRLVSPPPLRFSALSTLDHDSLGVRDPVSSRPLLSWSPQSFLLAKP